MFPEMFEWVRQIFDCTFYRQRVGIENGVKFIIHPNESGHNIPHIHAEYQGQNISISLTDYRVLAGTIPPPKQRLAVDWVKKNREKLEQNWNELTNRIYIPC